MRVWIAAFNVEELVLGVEVTGGLRETYVKIRYFSALTPAKVVCIAKGWYS
ncbi:uncharacterized protein GLRG_11973 [Colletotrichum graminicola M1.001]|uniref:Uncharacterized protein n=1 Tax=Colletotrichum graminicola (strain M1.001 / M2 / FGSC 10212) TaxID=645133 RepID=E3R138_COLGM|nr:uncharacterized protein GLRG_11973 [Colletotrichum graminicola M1.001]EFQ36826.1 hypothetical protein GLRG_11973 [Colletotrichum graminicola M1.001]